MEGERAQDPVARQREWMVVVAVMSGLTASGCSSSRSPAPSALTENDFAANPALRLQLHQVGAILLEPKGAGGGPGDTGDADSDVIPLQVTEARTFALALSELHDTFDRVRLLRLPGKETVLELSASTPVGSVSLAPGSYDLVVYSGYERSAAGDAPHRSVFLRPRPDPLPVGSPGARLARSRVALPVRNFSTSDSPSVPDITSAGSCADAFSDSGNLYWCARLCPTPPGGSAPLSCYQGLASAIDACEGTFTDNTNVNTCELACYQRIDPVLGLSWTQALACAQSIPTVTHLLSTNQCPGCDLAGANLSGANLAFANLSNAILDGASLRGSDLTGAQLTGASLSGTDLTGAGLASANLIWANVTGVSAGRAYLCRTVWADGKTLNGSCATSPPGAAASCAVSPNCHLFRDASNGFRCETVCPYGVGNRSCCVQGIVNVIDACWGLFGDPQNVWRCQNECQASDDGTWGLSAGHARNCAMNVAAEINAGTGRDPGPGWSAGCSGDPAQVRFDQEGSFTLDGPDPYGLWDWVATTLTPYAYANPAASGDLFNPMVWPTSHWEYYYGPGYYRNGFGLDGTFYFGSTAPGCQRAYMTANAFSPSWDGMGFPDTATFDWWFEAFDYTPLHDSLSASSPWVYRDGGFDDLRLLTGLTGDQLAADISSTYLAVGEFALFGALNTHTGNASLYLLCQTGGNCTFSNVPYELRYPLALFLGRVGNLTTYAAGTSIKDTFELHVGWGEFGYGSPLLFTYFAGTMRVPVYSYSRER